MSAVLEATRPAGQTKTFGKSTREVPHHSQKARKFYPAEDEPVAKKVRKTIRPSTPRASLTPGTILILLAGRFRGKRVVLLKNLDQGVLLVTGPFKINGVPLRRVNARYPKKPSTSRAADQKAIDKALLATIKKEAMLSAYLGSSFSLRKGDRPHEMAW
ncbi:putative 60S ribosomal protein L6-B [Diplocarpon rosae]|nr:putative 60S ribosomal protein L6-B [Diplocarpon rosae]